MPSDPGTVTAATARALGQRVLDLLFKWRREEVESGGRIYAAEIIREVREQVARDIETAAEDAARTSRDFGRGFMEAAKVARDG